MINLIKKSKFWLPTVDYKFPRILTYHMVTEPERGRPFRGLKVSPKAFEAQVKLIRDDGWTFYTLADLAAGWKSGSLPEKSICLTFDDGYRDNLTNALPILEKYDACGTIFLVVDRHNNDWVNRRGKKKGAGDELVRQAKLSDDEVRQLIESGRIEIGAHTITHDDLCLIDAEQQQQEIITGRVLLQKKFDIAVNTFCYPYGSCNKESVELCKQAGYTAATTTVAGIETAITPDFLQLPRIEVNSTTTGFILRNRLRHGV